MQELTLQECNIVSAGAKTSTAVKSGARIIAKNIARGFLIGSGIGTAAAVIWFAYDTYTYYNQ